MRRPGRACLGGYAMSPLNTLDATQFNLELGGFLSILIFRQRHFFAFHNGFCDLMGEPTCVTQNLMLVKFEEMVQSQHPVLHRHGNVSASLMFRIIQIKGCCRHF